MKFTDIYRDTAMSTPTEWTCPECREQAVGYSCWNCGFDYDDLLFDEKDNKTDKNTENQP